MKAIEQYCILILNRVVSDPPFNLYMWIKFKVWSLKWKLPRRTYAVYYALPDGSTISGHETKIGEGCMQAPGPNQMNSKEWLSRSAGYHSFSSSKLVSSSLLHFHEKS